MWCAGACQRARPCFPPSTRDSAMVTTVNVLSHASQRRVAAALETPRRETETPLQRRATPRHLQQRQRPGPWAAMPCIDRLRGKSGGPDVVLRDTREPGPGTQTTGTLSRRGNQKPANQPAKHPYATASPGLGGLRRWGEVRMGWSSRIWFRRPGGLSRRYFSRLLEARGAGREITERLRASYCLVITRCLVQIDSLPRAGG